MAQQINFEEELPILLIKEFDLKSYIKGYHAYMNIWEQIIEEILKVHLEPAT